MAAIPKLPIVYISWLLLLAAAPGAGGPFAGTVGSGRGLPPRFQESGRSLLEAARKGDGAAVKDLLSKGAALNYQTDDGTPLAVAVKEGHAEIVRLLLAAGAGVNVKLQYGDPLIILAARPSIPDLNPRPGAAPSRPSSEILRLLLAGGIDAKARGYWDTTALMSANSVEKARCLAAAGADVNARDQDGRTALMMAAERRDPEVVAALLENGADGNAVNAKGDTALICALDGTRSNPAGSSEAMTAMIRSLLAAHVNVNVQNKNGETALMRAVKLKDGKLVGLLLAAGADAQACDALGNSAAVFAYEKSEKEIENLLAGTAAQKPTPSLRNAFLRAAVEKMDEARVGELLQAGADPNYEFSLDYDHKTIKSVVLVLAARKGHPGIVQRLLDKGADRGAQGLVAGSEHGLVFGTALQAAEYYKQAGVISVLKKVHPEKK